MLIEKLSKKFVTFFECWFYPPCLVECLFNDFDNLGRFDKTQLGSLRLYQIPFLSSESIIDFDGTAKLNNLNAKAKFKLRKGAGDIFNLGARRYGKTLCTLKLDISLSALYEDNLWSALSSIDEKRIRGVLESVRLAFEYHPIFRPWKFVCKYKPAIKFRSEKNNWRLEGVNLTLGGKSPGFQYYQLHVSKLWMEEASFETKVVFEKRKESYSEPGAVLRFAGMTNFTRHSPLGEEFYDPKNKSKITNYPQYVSPLWDDEEREDRKKAYAGAQSINFRIYVAGEVVEDGLSAVDMERFEKCVNRKTEIKQFEITKDNFDIFESLIVVERPKNAERLFLASDVGDRSQSEIMIISEVAEKYNYLYNITLYNLTRKQHLKIYKWLINKLEANVIAIDNGDAFGRNLCDDLEEIYDKDNIVRYAGASKVNVGFEKDEKGNIKRDNKGNIIFREEFMSEWSVSRILVLLYEMRFLLPTDYKLELQLANVISTKSKSNMRRLYVCTLENDHLFDTFKIFAIAEWIKHFSKTPKMNENMNMSPGVSSWAKKSKE